MLIDDNGVLILSAAKSDNVRQAVLCRLAVIILMKCDQNPRVTTKRFPLSDLRPPYIPDQDRQELANSEHATINNCACTPSSKLSRCLP